MTKAEMDARYREKVAAIREGRAPVFVSPATGEDPNSPAAIDARYRAKVAARLAVQPVEQPPVVAAPPSEEEASGGEGFAAMTKAQLIEECKALDLDVDARMNKAQLIEALEAALG